MKTSDKILKASSIFKRYDGKVVLDDVSFEMYSGSITSIVGPSGSGKSTLLRAISMIDPPDEGTINIKGSKYIFPDSKKDIINNVPWPKITLVFQQLYLWPHLTLRENILLPIRRMDIEKSQELVGQLIEEFAVNKFIDRYPNQVSIGQRQLAAIIRALVLKPDFLLLDEITSALDVEYVNLVLNKLKEVCDSGVGVLLVTHYIGFARKSSDQVLFMDEGKIIESGKPDILMRPKSDRMKKFISLVNIVNNFVE